MKNYKKNSLFILLLSLSFIWGCKKDNTDNPGKSTTYKVKLTGTFSAGSTINNAFVSYGANVKTYTGLSGTTWTQELDLTESDLRATGGSAKNIGFGLSGPGKDANATGAVEIILNGVSVKKGESKGTSLSPNTTYDF